MEQFKNDASKSATYKPSIWLQYSIYDTFVIWSQGLEKLKKLLKHMKSIHPNIQITMEVETNRKWYFLDVLTTTQRMKKLDLQFITSPWIQRYIYKSPPTTKERYHKNTYRESRTYLWSKTFERRTTIWRLPEEWNKTSNKSLTTN